MDKKLYMDFEMLWTYWKKNHELILKNMDGLKEFMDGFKNQMMVLIDSGTDIRNSCMELKKYGLIENNMDCF